MLEKLNSQSTVVHFEIYDIRIYSLISKKKIPKLRKPLLRTEINYLVEYDSTSANCKMAR